MRQSQRDARQRRSPHAPPQDGGCIDVRELTDADLPVVQSRLPLHRLGNAQTYLVAWEGDEPLGHAHVAWEGTTLGIPEIQDVYVLPAKRSRGIGTQLSLAAERVARERGADRISISASVDNDGALRLYRRLGYADSGLPPERVQGTVQLRQGPLAVDDTLLYLAKDLGGS